MSTRSGKRIHDWFQETVESPEHLVPSKASVTRSKKLKENDVEIHNVSKLKKRRNYVGFLASDNAEGAIEETFIEAPVEKTVKKLRRYTLKEKNIIEPNTAEVEIAEKPSRTTRRNKKTSENTDATESEVNIDSVVNGKLTGKKNKKKTRNNVEEVEVQVERETKIPVPKSKKSKKKKKGAISRKVSSENEHNEESAKNNSVTSVESFYSAAGSPVKSSPKVKNGKKSKTGSYCTSEHQVEKESVNIGHPSPVNSKCKTRSSLRLRENSSNSMDIDHIDDKTTESQKDINNAVQDPVSEINSDKKPSRKRKSISQKESVEEIEDEKKTVEGQNSTFDKTPDAEGRAIKKSKRNSSLFKDSFNKIDVVDSSVRSNLESTFNKDEAKVVQVQNSTFDKNPETEVVRTSIRKSTRKSSLLTDSFNKTDVIDSSIIKVNVTFDKSEEKSSETKNATFDKSPTVSSQNSQATSAEKLNSTYDKISSSSKTVSLNSTYDKDPAPKIDTTFDIIETKTNSAKSSLISSDNSNVTLDKSIENSRVSITSDESKTENIINTTPVLIESSLDESQISYSAKKTSSNDQVKTPEKKEIKESSPQIIPLKCEGTFTIEEQNLTTMSPKRTVAAIAQLNTPQKTPRKSMTTTPLKTPQKTPRASIATTPQRTPQRTPRTSIATTPLKTPNRQMSLPSPGCTPFPGLRSASQHKSMNVTRSIEKSRRSSLAEEVPRQTRVMFCSPVDASTSTKQQRGKVIKSSMKGSNKSFVFEEDVASSSAVPALRRKRSLTADADHTSAKRSRLAEMLPAAERASRQRTASAIVKSTTQTPKPVTPSKTKADAKVSRTKLPNFAALHRKQFERMESLDECQERKAKRARHLLTPNGNIAVLERSSPNVTKEPVKPKETKQEAKKSESKKSETAKPAEPKPMLPTLESLRPGFTRFGFKMNIGVNPFISPIKSASKAKEINGLKRQGALLSLTGKKQNKTNIQNNQGKLTLPSVSGASSSRKETARNTVLREKSFSHSSKRDETRMENRTIIKGVRTNRRFELQMQMRNMD